MPPPEVFRAKRDDGEDQREPQPAEDEGGEGENDVERRGGKFQFGACQQQEEDEEGNIIWPRTRLAFDAFPLTSYLRSLGTLWT